MCRLFTLSMSSKVEIQMEFLLLFCMVVPGVGRMGRCGAILTPSITELSCSINVVQGDRAPMPRLTRTPLGILCLILK